MLRIMKFRVVASLALSLGIAVGCAEGTANLPDCTAITVAQICGVGFVCVQGQCEVETTVPDGGVDTPDSGADSELVISSDGGSDATPTCSTDSVTEDCGEGFDCENGVCVERIGDECTLETSTTDCCTSASAPDDCENNSSCAAGFCIFVDDACEDNADCGELTCRFLKCVPLSVAGEACEIFDDGDCESGLMCVDKICVAPDGATCSENSECENTCIDNVCTGLSDTSEGCDDQFDCQSETDACVEEECIDGCGSPNRTCDTPGDARIESACDDSFTSHSGITWECSDACFWYERSMYSTPCSDGETCALGSSGPYCCDPQNDPNCNL